MAPNQFRRLALAHALLPERASPAAPSFVQMRLSSVQPGLKAPGQPLAQPGVGSAAAVEAGAPAAG